MSLLKNYFCVLERYASNKLQDFHIHEGGFQTFINLIFIEFRVSLFSAF